MVVPLIGCRWISEGVGVLRVVLGAVRHPGTVQTAALVVSVLSALIAGVALWRSWRWQPREARFELVAQEGSELGQASVVVYVVNVGDVAARGVRYELERAALVGDQRPARNAEIVPGTSGDQIYVARESDGWERAAVVVSWHPFPVHRGKRKRQRLSIGAAIADAPPGIDISRTIY